MTDRSDGHLEDLLDEALEDFQDAGAGLEDSPPRPANESVGTGSSHPGLPAKSQGSASGSSNGSITSREAKGKQAAKGLTFNPLPKRASAKSSGLKAHPAAANGGTIGTPSSSVASSYNQQQRSFGAIPPDVMGRIGQEGLAEGIEQLMAELAQVDLAMHSGAAANGGAAGSSAGSSSSSNPGSTQSKPREGTNGPEQVRSRDIGATLQALAEQTRSLQPDTGPPAGPSDRSQAGGPADEEFLRQLRAAGLPDMGAFGGGAGPGAEATFADSIMRQLLSKEVLYQPMQDIGAKYPQWLAENRSSLSMEDISRYERQYGYIKKVCQVYETRPESFAELLELMHEMQACGQPPPEIVDELAPGLAFGEDGPLGAGGEAGNGPQVPGCPMQ